MVHRSSTPSRRPHATRRTRSRLRLQPLEDRTVPTFAMDGPEFRVNTQVVADQNYSDVAMNAAGDSVIAWEGHDANTSYRSVYAQRYDSAGQAAGHEIQVNQYIGNSQVAPHVAMDAAGNFVVAWYGYNSILDPYLTGVFARAFRADGTPLGDEFLVNTGVRNNYQQDPDVAMAPDGRFAITWGGFNLADNPSVQDIAAQRYTLAGGVVSPVGDNFLVNAPTTVGDQFLPQVAMNAAGVFVVAWHGNGPHDASDIWFQRFAADGTPVGDNTPVNTDYFGFTQREPDVAIGPGGDFLVAWSGNGGPDPSDLGVYVQRYDAAGSPLGGNTWVNTHFATGQQSRPRVARDDAGSALVTWYGLGGPDVSDGGVYGRRYDPAGDPVGDEFQINTTVVYYQRYPTVAVNAANGDTVVSWSSTFQDGSNDGVYAQRFVANRRPTTAGIPDLPMNEDAAAAVVNLPSYFKDAETAAAGLTYTYSITGTPGLFTSTAINPANQLVLNPARNAFGTATVTVRAADEGKSVETSFTVTVLAVNDPPNAVTDAAALVEDGGAQAIDVLANDTTGLDLGENLTVTSVTQGMHGTVAIGPGGQSVLYTPDADYAGPDSFLYAAGDGNGGSDFASVAVTVTNDAADRVELVVSPGPVTFTEGGGAVPVDAGLRVGSGDEGTITSATVRFATGYVKNKDKLVFTPAGTIKGAFSVATGALNLSGAASPADYETALRGVRYTNPSSAPVDGVRAVAFRVNDAAGAGEPAVRLLRVVGVNSKPIASLTGTAQPYKRGAAALVVTGTLKIADVDNTRLLGARVTVGGGFAANLDVLSVVAKLGITAHYDGASGVLTLSGNATLAAYLAVLKTVKFSTAATAPTGPRTLSLTANDGLSDSDPVVRTVNVV
jgi:hypothetical protein